MLDAIVNYLPSPAERPFTALAATTREEVSREMSPSGPYAAFVWKTVADPFAGRITLFRVMTGTLKADSTVFNLTRETPERLGHLSVMQGKTATNVPELRAGDIGAVAKLKDTLTNDTLAEKAAGLVFAPIPFPGTRAVLRHRAEEPRGRRQDQHVDAPPRGGGPDHSVHAGSADEGASARRARASCTSR